MDSFGMGFGDESGGNAFQRGFSAARDKAQQNKAKSTIRKASMPARGLETTKQTVSALVPSAKKGGHVKQGGLVRVHRGEDIVPAKQARKAKSKASNKRTTAIKA